MFTLAIYRLIDALPESEIVKAKRFLQGLMLQQSSEQQWKEFLYNPPIDHETLSEDALKAIEEAEKDIEEGRTVPWEQCKKELDL